MRTKLANGATNWLFDPGPLISLFEVSSASNIKQIDSTLSKILPGIKFNDA